MTEGLFYDIYVRSAGLQGDEKMKPIFSTEQARYQKFASFFIDVTGVSLSAESDQGSAFGNRHLLKKVDENFLALVQLFVFARLSFLVQPSVFIRFRPWLSC